MEMKKECKGLPDYETPSMVTYQAKDIVEEVGVTCHTSPNGCDSPCSSYQFFTHRG